MNRIDIAGDKPFSIVYVPSLDMLIIDGVSCSVELIRQIIVEPRTDVGIRFERKENTVHAHTIQIAGVNNDAI